MSEATVDWRRLREFNGVDLTRSFVLSWQLRDTTLEIELDLFLLPEHPFYEKPRPAEKVCIRPAVLEFPHCDALRTEAGGESHAPADVAAGLRLGAIDGMRRMDDGPFEIDGEFGTVIIDAERPILRLSHV